jgi:peroxiredoxin Q/BCP
MLVLAVACATAGCLTTKPLAVRTKAPVFTAQSTTGDRISLSDLRGKWVVLYFFPKAGTPKCTREACSLRDGYAAIQKEGAVIIGVTRDKLPKLREFKNQNALPFDFVADPKKGIRKAYGVLGLFGLLTSRRTFLINPSGRIAHVFDKVDVDSHDKQILSALKELKAIAAE